MEPQQQQQQQQDGRDSSAAAAAAAAAAGSSGSLLPAIISPSILAADFANLAQEVNSIQVRPSACTAYGRCFHASLIKSNNYSQVCCAICALAFDTAYCLHRVCRLLVLTGCTWTCLMAPLRPISR
jgi:hypothetical protein